MRELAFIEAEAERISARPVEIVEVPWPVWIFGGRFFVEVHSQSRPIRYFQKPILKPVMRTLGDNFLGSWFGRELFQHKEIRHTRSHLQRGGIAYGTVRVVRGRGHIMCVGDGGNLACFQDSTTVA